MKFQEQTTSVHWLNALDVIEKGNLHSAESRRSREAAQTLMAKHPDQSLVQAGRMEVNEQSKSNVKKSIPKCTKTCLAKLSHIFTQQANALNIRSSFRMLANNLKSKSWTVVLGNGKIFACPQSRVDVFHPNCFFLVVQILGTVRVAVLGWQLFLELTLCDLKLFQHFLRFWMHWFQAETINLLNHFLAMTRCFLWKQPI